MVYYAQIEVGVDKFDTYGPYKTMDEARRNLKRIYLAKYKKNNLLLITTSRENKNGIATVGEVNRWVEHGKTKCWLYFSDPNGKCIPYIMNDDGSLRRRISDEEWFSHKLR